MERVVVGRDAENSIVSGHLWVFSNEVLEKPAGVAPGESVEIYGQKGRLLGVGYINPRSLISVRLLARERISIDPQFFERRIRDALRLREGRFEGSFRVVNTESDFLPGLVIDKYEECVALQFLTAGMERQREAIVEAVERVLSPGAIVLRNDSPAREEEGLPQYRETIKGSVADGVIIRVGPLKFRVDVLEGHKTGFYFDQRENRLLLEGYARGASVLDCFSYTGAFGLYALYFGARSVTFVDSSARSMDVCRENMKLNGLSGGEFVKSDVFDFLRSSEEAYDLMILDPPSFIKTKKKIKEGEKGHIDLHKKALRRLADDGLLFTFSCSHHMRRQRFRDLARVAAYGAADIYLLRELSQAADHPVLLTIPETEYLKGLILRVRKR